GMARGPQDGECARKVLGGQGLWDPEARHREGRYATQRNDRERSQQSVRGLQSPLSAEGDAYLRLLHRYGVQLRSIFPGVRVLQDPGGGPEGARLDDLRKVIR